MIYGLDWGRWALPSAAPQLSGGALGLALDLMGWVGNTTCLEKEEIQSGGVQLNLEGFWKDQLLESSACCWTVPVQNRHWGMHRWKQLFLFSISWSFLSTEIVKSDDEEVAPPVCVEDKKTWVCKILRCFSDNLIWISKMLLWPLYSWTVIMLWREIKYFIKPITIMEGERRAFTNILLVWKEAKVELGST